MTMEYKTVESSIYPKTIDTSSSKDIVYIRKNIEEKLRKDNKGIYYQYQEMKLTKEQYRDYVQEQIKADVEYIALMEGVYLEEDDTDDNKLYYKIKEYYNKELWNKFRLKEIAKKNILTEGQYMLITGEYIEIEE